MPLIVHNDFYDSQAIFALFNGLEVQGLDAEIEINETFIEGLTISEKPITNGTNGIAAVNGNGVIKEAATNVTGGASVQTSRLKIAN